MDMNLLEFCTLVGLILDIVTFVIWLNGRNHKM